MNCISKKNQITCLSALLLFIALPLPVQAFVDCLFYTGCERKICELEHEIESALDHGNVGKADKLKRELTEFRTHCPDGADSVAAAHELSSLCAGIREYEEELADVKREFREKAEQASLHMAHSKALDELDEELADAEDDVAEAGDDLREAVDEYLDEMADLGSVSGDLVAETRTLIREIVRAESGLDSVERALDADLSNALARIGAGDRESVFRGGIKDISAELAEQRETLRGAGRAAQSLLDRAS